MSASLIGRLGSSTFRLYPPLQCRCLSRARASLRNRHLGPSIMGSAATGKSYYPSLAPETVTSIREQKYKHPVPPRPFRKRLKCPDARNGFSYHRVFGFALLDVRDAKIPVCKHCNTLRHSHRRLLLLSKQKVKCNDKMQESVGAPKATRIS